MREEVTVKGVWNSSYTSSNNEWHKVLLELTAKQGLFSQLITSKFPLSDGITVFEAIKGSEKLEIKGMFVNE